MDISSILNQIISYIKSMFASFDAGGMSENSLVNTVTEYINGVIENFSSAGLGFDANELRSQVVDDIKNTFAGTPEEGVAEKIENNVKNPATDIGYTYSRNKIPTTFSGGTKLLVINGTDYTRFIKMPTWKVNSKDIYEEKTNANKKFIRNVSRTRIMGNFTIVFNNTDEYAKFISDLWNGKGSSGEVSCELWVNNMLSMINTKIYFTIDPAEEAPYMGARTVNGFEITVEEY